MKVTTKNSVKDIYNKLITIQCENGIKPISFSEFKKSIPDKYIKSACDEYLKIHECDLNNIDRSSVANTKFEINVLKWQINTLITKNNKLRNLIKHGYNKESESVDVSRNGRRTGVRYHL